MSIRADQVAPAIPSLGFLTDEEAAALPPRRSDGLRAFAAVVAALVTLVFVFTLEVQGFDSPRESRTDRLFHFMAGVGPWLICLPWLHRLDVRRVPWFFLCAFLGPFFAPWLVSMVVSRALALPHRDWRAQYWHVSQARNVPGTRTWVLVPADRSRRYQPEWWERVLSVGWAAVIISMVPLFLLLEGRVDNELGILWVTTFVAVAVGALVGDLVERRRSRARGVAA